MRILLVHNHYQQPGGEDRVFLDEGLLLDAHGHRVLRYTVRNDDLDSMSRPRLAQRTIWNEQIGRELGALVRKEQIELAHFHNTLPLVSPAAYRSVRQAGARVVQTLHNYRLLCPGALFVREGRVCEDCMGRKFAWPGVVHGCYRGSRAATVVVASMTAVHHMLGTWTEQVDAYVAITQFVREKFIQGGFPAEKLFVKPHFVDPDPGPGPGDGGYALFVGRLSPEKGIQTLLEAWDGLSESIPLRIVGDGPLASQVEAAAVRNRSVSWLGRQTPEQIAALVARATLVVVPSECYETFGRVVIEAFAGGTPVVASNIGAIAELVSQGRTGVLFKPGDPGDLTSKVQWMLRSTEETARMRRLSREEFERHYTADHNYRMLMEIYEAALSGGRSDRDRPVGAVPAIKTQEVTFTVA